MRSRRVFIGFAAALVGASFTPPAHALTLRRPLADRVRQAQYIVVGTVTETTSTLERMKGMRVIWMTVRLKVTQGLKAPAEEAMPEHVTVRLLGGQVGELTMHASDTVELRRGDRVVLLLQKGVLGQQACRVVNGPFGAYLVSTDPATQEEVVSNPFEQPTAMRDEVAGSAALHIAASASPPSSPMIPLSKWLDRLEELLVTQASP